MVKDVKCRIDRQNRSTGATCARPHETKREKETLQWQLAIRPDHARRQIEIPFGMVGGLLTVVISFKFHQHQLSSYGAVRGQNLADLIT